MKKTLLKIRSYWPNFGTISNTGSKFPTTINSKVLTVLSDLAYSLFPNNQVRHACLTQFKIHDKIKINHKIATIHHLSMYLLHWHGSKFVWRPFIYIKNPFSGFMIVTVVHKILIPYLLCIYWSVRVKYVTLILIWILQSTRKEKHSVNDNCFSCRFKTTFPFLISKITVHYIRSTCNIEPKVA